MSKRTAALAVVVGVLASAGLAPARQGSAPVTTVATWSGTLGGLAAGGGHVVWCSERASGQTIHDGARTFRASRRGRIWCGGVGPVQMWAVARGTIAFGGYEEVRCSDTHWAVYVATNAFPKEVEHTAHGCIGYGRTFVGLASDGSSVLYATTVYGDATDADECEIDDRCVFRVTGGGVYRVVAGRRVKVPHLGASGAFAAGAGLVALAQPLTGGPYPQLSVPPLPAPKPGGLVAVRSSADGHLVSQARPRGAPTALAVTRTYLVAVEPSALEWFDVRTGAAAGSIPVTGAHDVAASGSLVVYAAANGLHVVDLRTKSDTVLWHGRTPPLDPAIDGTRVVWATRTGSTVSILETTVRG